MKYMKKAGEFLRGKQISEFLTELTKLTEWGRGRFLTGRHEIMKYMKKAGGFLRGKQISEFLTELTKLTEWGGEDF